MSDLVEDAIVDASGHSAELLLYDYFKHLSTLSLVTLGGMLSIPQGDGAATKASMTLVTILVAAGGVFALQGQTRIIKARTRGGAMPYKWLAFDRNLATGCFGVGLGAFLAIYLKGVT